MRHITEALARSGARDVVCVGPGTYGEGEQLPLVIPDHVTLKASEGPSSTTFTGSGSWNSGAARVAMLPGDGSVLEGFTIRIPASDPGTVHVGVLAAAGRAEIRGHIIEDIAWGFTGGAGVAAMGDAHPVIAKNVITGCHDGVAALGVSAPEIHDNTLIDNENNGVYADEQAVPDLGTAGAPGGNTIVGNGIRGLYNHTTASTIPAVGNTWNVNCTTDVAGRYSVHLVSGPADDATDCMGGESNYRVQNAAAAIQF